MNDQRLVNIRFGFWLGLALLALMPPLRADIKVTGASLRYGRSPRLSASDWAYFRYSLDNSEDQEVTVRLSLRAPRHGRAVYEKVLTIGPKARLNGREPVTAAATETYLLSVFRDGERIIRTDIPSRYTDPMTHCALLFLNDDPEFAGASQLGDLGLLREPVIVTTSTGAMCPHHWAAFGHTRALVLVKPDYHDMSALQFAAILEYVHRGGTLLFADPDGTLAAARTPLRELLPVDPLRVRRIESLPDLDAWGAAWWSDEDETPAGLRPALASPDGFRFLESVSSGHGMTTLSHGEFPLIRWRRCGLGRVGMIAVDPCHERIRASGIEVPLWNHILSWSNAPFAMRNYSNSRLLPRVLSQLTGFRIPSVGVIAAVLWGYAAIVLLVLVGGYAKGRHVAAWVASAVLGLVLTVGIFVAATLQNADRASQSAALLDLRASSGTRTTGHAVVSLFTKHDMRPSLRDQRPGNLIRPLPSAARGKRKEPLEAPLIVRQENDISMLPDINLTALRPRELISVHTDSPVSLEREPALVYSAAEPVLRDASIPAELDKPGTRAFLLVSSSLIPLNRRGEEWHIPADTRRLVQFNTFMQELSGYLVDGGFPHPALILLCPWQHQSSRLTLSLDAFEQRGYRIEFLPVGTQVAGTSVELPPEFVAVRPAGNFARMMLKDGKWRSDVLRRPETIIPVEVVLPPALSDMRLQSVTVDLDYSNAGGNVRMVPRLTGVPLSTPSRVAMLEPERAWKDATGHETAENGVFTFSSLQETALLQPLYGSFRLLIQASQKEFVRAGFEADRSNRYRITRLRVSVTGRRESDALSKRF